MTSKQFDVAYARTLAFEKGYSNDTADRGGKTKNGITQEVWEEFGGEGDVSGMTSTVQRNLYLKKYWEGSGVSELCEGGVPQDLLSEAFDACVNHGIYGGVKRLQAAYNLVKADGPDLAVDGILGRKSLAAISGFCGVGRNYCDSLLAALRGERWNLYTSLSVSDPSQRKFIRGWLRRLV